MNTAIPLAAVKRELSHAFALAWLSGRWEFPARESTATRARLSQAWMWVAARRADGPPRQLID